MQDITSSVGQNIKTIRRRKDLTLDGAAELTGVSKSMLGEIERGVTNPTVTLLWKIANGLKVPLSSFLREGRDAVTVVRLDDTRLVSDCAGARVSMVHEYDASHGFEVFTKELSPGHESFSEGHGEDVTEYVLVCQGEFSVEVDGLEYTLRAGESMKFRCHRPHAYRNHGAEMAWAFMLFCYDDE